MNKLIRIISRLNYEELIRLQRDLRAGNIDRLIEERLSLVRPTEDNVCPVCHNKIDENSYTLIFGHDSFRKKASFCALDCLEYFVNTIKQEVKNANR
jgi:hypothetical protein